MVHVLNLDPLRHETESPRGRNWIRFNQHGLNINERKLVYSSIAICSVGWGWGGEEGFFTPSYLSYPVGNSHISSSVGRIEERSHTCK